MCGIEMSRKTAFGRCSYTREKGPLAVECCVDDVTEVLEEIPSMVARKSPSSSTNRRRLRKSRSIRVAHRIR